MRKFPKKYKPNDLRNWSKFYREKWEEKKSDSSVFAPISLNISDKVSYDEFFLIYLRDFFNCVENLKKSDILGSNWIYQNLFLVSNNQFKNICSSFSFFYKRNQSLPQVWVNKLEKHIQSVVRKNLVINSKIINTDFSSPHKILMLDSSIYLYIINQLRFLYEKWKISKQTNINYWSFNLQCSIPSRHIIWKEEKKNYYILKYFIWSKCEALPIIVDDIDLCCGDVGLLVHPKDKRYNKYIWKKAIIPLSNRQIPIIWDESVNIASNNWIKRICPCADQESIELARKYWLPLDIYVFDKEWLYTDYIHEKAFIWQERNKYYKNIEWFMWDIWNLTEKKEILKKVPYLKYTNECLVPFKMDQIVIDITEEKERFLNDIFQQNLKISFIEDNFWTILEEIKQIGDKIRSVESLVGEKQGVGNFEDEWEGGLEDELKILEKEKSDLKNKVINELNNFLPNNIVCNTQLPYWWRVPVFFDSDWNFSFFDLESFFSWENLSIQKCFDLVLLFLVNLWVLWNRWFYDKKNDLWKICEYEKIFQVFSQNEKKICNFVLYLSENFWENFDSSKLLKIFQNLGDESNSTINDCRKLLDNSEFLIKERDWLFFKFQWISDDVLDPDFVQFCVWCYVNSRENSKINPKIVYDRSERNDIFYQIILQYLFLWNPISTEFLEMSYDKEKEFLWEKELSKLQLEQTQWNMFNLYWENPIRLGLLLNKTYDQKEILLNNIFLKQVWNAVRFCIKEGFLLDDIKNVLSKTQRDFSEVDLFVLYKLSNLYDEWKDINDFDSYIVFFNNFKLSVQDLFFSWYLEIQKSQVTKDVEFVCSYFLNFLLTVLYPLVPEYVNALSYMSWKKFIAPFEKVILNKTIDYNINLIYDTFVRIKKLKIKWDIKQHECCSVFIKSSPNLLEVLKQYEQVFRKFYHISNITYLRLHEQDLLWYEIDSDDIISIWIKLDDNSIDAEKWTIEFLEKEIKRLEDKLWLIRERMQILGEWEQYLEAEQEYEKIKDEMENLSIKYSLLSGK